MKSSIRRAAFRCLAFAAAATTVTAAFTPPVTAADLPVKSRTEPVVRPLWSGFYFGVHGGWAWSSSSYDEPSAPPQFQGRLLNGDGPIAGGQIGVNWQHGNVVMGLELDGSWASLRAPFPSSSGFS